MNKRGFTLIELLAVIVILAIIAVIAVPIVLNIIDETKSNATLRSADFYLDAVEMAVANSTLNGTPIPDGTYKILENGNICLVYQKDGVTCINELKVEVNGEVPKQNSKVTIVDGQIKTVKLKYEEKEVVKDEKNQIVYLENKYTIGQEVTFDPGDGEKTWNVIDEDGTTVTLMLTENLGTTYAWYKYSNHNTEDTSDYGPKDALEYLNSLTTNWDNIDPIESYTYINNLNTTISGYKKLEIKNGVTKLTHKDGQIITNVTGESKARLLTLDEVFEIAQKTNTNLTEENLRQFISDDLGTVNTLLQAQGMDVELTTVDEVIAFVTQLEGLEWMQYESKYIQTYFTVVGMITQYGINPTYDILLPDYLYDNLDNDETTTIPYGYWTLSSSAYNSYNAWDVEYDGDANDYHVSYEYYRGVRPVITVSKSLSLQIVE